MTPTLNVTVPSKWSELTQSQLRDLLQIMIDVQAANRNIRFRSMEDYAVQTSAQVSTLCLLKWAHFRVVCASGVDGWLVAHDGEEYVITTSMFAGALSHLNWTKELPDEPVRLDEVDDAKAVPADISENFTFDNWLTCEALWQGYQLTSDESLLRQMAEVLYNKTDIKPTATETLGIFYWWAAVKTMVSEMFPNFFQPSGNGCEQISADGIRRSMDAQIRALTKGDITKESEVLSMGALRALTELDAQAREYEELNRKYPSQ